MNKIFLVALSLTIGLVSLVGQSNGQSAREVQSYINGEFETIINYCVEHAGDKQNPILDLFGVKPANPIQDLIYKGLVAEHFNDDSCQSVKAGYDFMRLMPMEKWIEALQQADEKTVQKLMTGKDCPANSTLVQWYM